MDSTTKEPLSGRLFKIASKKGHSQKDANLLLLLKKIMVSRQGQDSQTYKVDHVSN
jgi:hypothetical protein